MNTLEWIKEDLERNGNLEKYVILKKDDKGYYIEYAFKEGAPHDNRCLSWYDSYQPNALERNGHNKEVWKTGVDNKLGLVHKLYSFTCGYEENPERKLKEAKEAWEEYKTVTDPFVPEDHICKVGCAALYCRQHGYAGKNWTYEEPVKCGCWALSSGTTMEEFINNYQISIKANDLAEIEAADLSELIDKLQTRYPEVSFAKLCRIVSAATKWQKQQIK